MPTAAARSSAPSFVMAGTAAAEGHCRHVVLQAHGRFPHVLSVSDASTPPAPRGTGTCLGGLWKAVSKLQQVWPGLDCWKA